MKGKMTKIKSTFKQENKIKSTLVAQKKQQFTKKTNPTNNSFKTSLSYKTQSSLKKEQSQTKIQVNQLPNQSLQTSLLEGNSSQFLQIQSMAHEEFQYSESAFLKEKSKTGESQLSQHSLSTLILNQYRSAEAIKIQNYKDLGEVTSTLSKKTEGYESELQQKDVVIKQLEKENKSIKSKIMKLEASISQNANIISQRMTEKQNQQTETLQLKQKIEGLQSQLSMLKEKTKSKESGIFQVQETQPNVVQLLNLILENKKIKSTLNTFKEGKWQNKKINLSKRNSLQESLRKIREVSRALSQN